MTNRLFLPPAGTRPSREEIACWYGNVRQELAMLPLEPAERQLFTTYYTRAGLLTSWRRPFFDHHYSRPLSQAIQELFARKDWPVILDLGCGTGTQALLFAMLGATVVGVDFDETALGVLAKRKSFYEERSGRTLDVRIVHGDVFSIELGMFAPVDAVYSLFAFNMMQPSETLLTRLATHLATDAVIVVQDGNREHFFNRLWRRRKVLSIAELDEALRAVGFRSTEHLGAYAIPPSFWAILPRSLLEPIDRVLARSRLLAVSYLHIARR